ncbi:MAG: ABC transporter substrate-binding protein [Clostridiales bacterium]|nr:ABC transporter substrate-binding protein [Clostridiales bacterium]MBO4748045.1 ABC transporter substrate-binding protein [Clostridiales bacterium]
MKKPVHLTVLLLLLAAIATACRSNAVPETTEEPVSDIKTVNVGFSQLGAESDWRSAHTDSILTALSKENGFNLTYKNGQQKQANQVTALRMFIQQDVDYIVLAPETETGWDFVLKEAKDAGIPVIIVDRRVDVEDQSLYSCWVGSDFELEGKKMCAWINEYSKINGIAPEDLHIVHIQGTLGSTAQIGRTRGLNNAVQEYGWDLLAQENGEFTETRGKEVMASFLNQFDNINVVYCENDNEAIGAIEAIEATGRKVGSDIKNGEIMVVSFDGINEEAMQYLQEGKISCIGECNPLHGPRVLDLINTLEEGKEPEKYNYVPETLFSSVPEIKSVTVDGETYSVTIK